MGEVGVALTHFNTASVAHLPLPVPPLEEQEEIVRVLHDRFAAITRLEKEVSAANSALDVLDAAVLAKAFRGELAPQDPNEEPASALLERIRAEREKADENGTKRATRGRKVKPERIEQES
jgi:type I restriction enzyme, S subunit